MQPSSDELQICECAPLSMKRHEMIQSPCHSRDWTYCVNLLAFWGPRYGCTLIISGKCILYSDVLELIVEQFDSDHPIYSTKAVALAEKLYDHRCDLFGRIRDLIPRRCRSGDRVSLLRRNHLELREDGSRCPRGWVREPQRGNPEAQGEET